MIFFTKLVAVHLGIAFSVRDAFDSKIPYFGFWSYNCIRQNTAIKKKILLVRTELLNARSDNTLTPLVSAPNKRVFTFNQKWLEVEFESS